MSSQYSNQFSQRQQLMLQAQQNLFNPSVSSFDSKRPRVLVGRGGQSNPAGGSVPNIGTPQIDSPELFPFLKVSTIALYLNCIKFSTTFQKIQ
jgi:hypothetical protein